MQSLCKLPNATLYLLRCPICISELELCEERYICKNSDCSSVFPIINGVPVLINENCSLFSINDFVAKKQTTFYSKTSAFEKTLLHFLPEIVCNVRGNEKYNKLAQLLFSQCCTPRVLVLGGSTLGREMGSLIAHQNIEFVDSDVAFGPRTTLICDAHNIPFADNSFDCVVVQAVLEHVVDPWRCVEEIHRVLKEDGLVYAETPFMQQVHGGRYDFTRFTHLGHRRLFRKFEEIDSGVICGPAMALAWSYKYFLSSFVGSSVLRKLVGVFARLTSFYLTWFDYLLVDKAGALDAASGYYFIGRRSNLVLSDKELIKLYRGLDIGFNQT